MSPGRENRRSQYTAIALCDKDTEAAVQVLIPSSRVQKNSFLLQPGARSQRDRSNGKSVTTQRSIAVAGQPSSSALRPEPPSFYHPSDRTSALPHCILDTTRRSPCRPNRFRPSITPSPARDQRDLSGQPAAVARRAPALREGAKLHESCVVGRVGIRLVGGRDCAGPGVGAVRRSACDDHS